eukprot:UN04138
MTDYTLRLLIYTARMAGASDYEDLMEACFGDSGYYFVSICMFIMDYGAMLTYLIILADSSTQVCKTLFGWKGEWVRAALIWGLSLVFILPWCLARDMTGLEKASLFSVFTVVAIIIIVGIEFSVIITILLTTP